MVATLVAVVLGVKDEGEDESRLARLETTLAAIDERLGRMKQELRGRDGSPPPG